MCCVHALRLTTCSFTFVLTTTIDVLCNVNTPPPSQHKQELLTCIHHVLRCCGPDRESPPRGGHAWRQNRRHGGDAAESGARLAQRIVHACEHAKLWEPGGDESADRGNGQQHRVSIGFFTPSSPGPLSQVPTATATKPLLTDDELRHVHSLALLAGAALPSPRSPASSARNGDVSDVVPMTSAQDTPTHGLKYTAGVYAAIVTEMLARGSAPHREVVQDLLTAVESEGGVAAVDGRPAYGTEEYAGVPTNTPHYVSHPPVYLQVQRDTHLAQVGLSCCFVFHSGFLSLSLFFSFVCSFVRSFFSLVFFISFCLVFFVFLSSNLVPPEDGEPIVV